MATTQCKTVLGTVRAAPMPPDSHCMAPPSLRALAQLLVSAPFLAGIVHHLAAIVAVLAIILPLLPTITRNVKLTMCAAWLEFSDPAASAIAALPKSGKNGNVFRCPSNELGRTVSHPAPALASTPHSWPWAFLPPSPLANLHYNASLPSSVFLCVLCGRSRSLSLSPLRPPRPPRLLLLPRQPAQHRLQDAPVA